MEFDHIVGVHDSHPQLRRRTFDCVAACFEVPSDSDFVAVHEGNRRGRKACLALGGVYLVIHMDPIDINNAYVNALRERPTACSVRSTDGLPCTTSA